MTSVSTLVLEVVSADGLAAWRDPGAGPGYRSFQATPPHVFDDWQRGDIGITIRHAGPRIGVIDYLETDCGYGNGGIFGVGVVEGVPADMLDGTVYCSPEIRCDALASIVGRGRSTTSTGTMHATKAVLDAVAIVDATAGLGAVRVRAWPGDFRVAHQRHNMGRGVPAIIERAAEATKWEWRYSRPHRLRIRRPVEDVDLPEWRSGVRSGFAKRWPAEMELSYTAPYPGVLSVRSA